MYRFLLFPYKFTALWSNGPTSPARQHGAKDKGSAPESAPPVPTLELKPLDPYATWGPLPIAFS